MRTCTFRIEYARPNTECQTCTTDDPTLASVWLWGKDGRYCHVFVLVDLPADVGSIEKKLRAIKELVSPKPQTKGNTHE